MLTSCVVIVASMCFHDPVSVAVHDTGLNVYAVVETAAAEVRVDIRGDQILFLDLRKLPGACAGDFCVAYHRKCSKGDAEIECTYSYAIPGDNLERTLELKAPSKERLDAAERSISILSPLGQLAGEIPLTELKMDAASQTPPLCRASGPLADCWPSGPR